MILILNASPRRHGNISQMVEVMADECRQAGVEMAITLQLTAVLF